jgi:hypothetical protein
VCAKNARTAAILSTSGSVVDGAGVVGVVVTGVDVVLVDAAVCFAPLEHAANELTRHTIPALCAKGRRILVLTFVVRTEASLPAGVV